MLAGMKLSGHSVLQRKLNKVESRLAGFAQ